MSSKLASTQAEHGSGRSDAFIGYSEERHSSGRAAGGCQDKEGACREWKDARECLLNPNFMREHCPVSCGSCKGAEPRARVRVTGSISTADSRAFSLHYPAAATKPVAATHFRYDPSLGELEDASGGMRMRPWHMLSSLGVGTYLGNEDEETDEQVVSAIVKSVAHGCNVIDTARIYRHGRGEDSVRQALDMLTRHGVRRSSLFISTKAGFMPENLSRELLASGKIAQTDLRDGHCMHPVCLAASLEQSLAALNLETVDTLYLHNAEVQLTALGRQQFFARLEAAFAALEKFRAAGQIRSYGMATWNCFRVPPSAAGYTSLQEVVDLAAKVGGKSHGFRYIQLPINVAMREAWQQPWQTVRPRSESAPQGRHSQLPLTAAAARLGVGVFASGPLSEAALLEDTDMMGKLLAAHNIAGGAAITNPAVAALQVARSTPYVISAVVGHKTPEHVTQNLDVVRAELLSPEQFKSLMSKL